MTSQERVMAKQTRQAVRKVSSRPEGPLEKKERKRTASLVEQLMAPFRELRPDPDCLYTTNHLWLKQRSAQSWRMGMDSFAARLFAHVHELVFPVPGRFHPAGSYLLWVNNPAGMIALRSPLPFLVMAINSRVREEPRILLADPQHDGWLLEGRCSPEENEDAIIPHPSLADWWHKSINWLSEGLQERVEQAMMNPALGETLQNGGLYIHDLSHILGTAGYWELLQRVLELKQCYLE